MKQVSTSVIRLNMETKNKKNCYCPQRVGLFSNGWLQLPAIFIFPGIFPLSFTK